jgi:type II secretory pathway pseudopilin PulG
MSVRRRPASGFGVLEVLVSAAILGVVVAATTACVTQALAERARQGVRRAAVSAAAAEIERLRALRFAPEPAPLGLDPDGVAPGSALGELFPHARPQCDGDDARCVVPDTPGDAVWFERTLRFPWGKMILESRFVEVTPAGLVTVCPEVGVDGWAVWSGESPPAGALLVLVTATVADRSWSFAVSATLASGA